MNLEDLLASWTAPSSDTEQQKQDRTVRMVRSAIDSHSAFDGYGMKVYAKGSYPNNTNVRTESDVDIAVHCPCAYYWDDLPASKHTPDQNYAGIWTPTKLRSEVEKALRAKFPNQVDSTGNVAIKVATSTARVDADVVPCFDYRFYYSQNQYHEGATIFRKDGSRTHNYPQQHLDQGRAKNTRTSHNYKKTVRILKRTANSMTDERVHREVASFFIESLVYNCPDNLFLGSSWVKKIEQVIVHIFENTKGNVEPADPYRLLEANGIKYLFHQAQSWNRQDAQDFVLAAWKYLGYSQ